MAREKALAYVRACRTGGQIDLAIEQALAGAGWQQAEIRTILESPGSQPMTDTGILIPQGTVDMALVQRGHQHRAAGNWDMAVRAYTEAIDNAEWPDPDLGQAYRGRAEVSRQMANGIQRADMDMANACLCEAEAARCSGRYREALDILAQTDVLDLLPGQRVVILNGRSDVHRNLGEYTAAIADCTSALALLSWKSWRDSPGADKGPARASALYSRARAYCKLGEYDAAVADITDAILLWERPNFLTLRCEVYERQGDTEHALADINAAVRIAPQDLLLYIDRARFHLRRGNTPEALSDWRQAKQLATVYPAATAACVDALQRLTDDLERLQACRPAGGNTEGLTPGRLMELTPEQFERLVGRVLQCMGYTVQYTPTSGDGGIDVIASHEDDLNAEWIAVQCKRYAKPVGRPEAQALIGAASADTRYTKGVLVGVFGFSRQCIEYARQQGRLELWDGAILCEKMVGFGLGLHE